MFGGRLWGGEVALQMIPDSAFKNLIKILLGHPATPFHGCFSFQCCLTSSQPDCLEIQKAFCPYSYGELKFSFPLILTPELSHTNPQSSKKGLLLHGSHFRYQLYKLSI